MKLIEWVGFKDPIVLDSNNTIRAGHGRIIAAERLGMTEVPYVLLEGLSDTQMDLFIYMDNQINESPWIKDNVELILKDIPMEELEVFDIEWEGIVKQDYKEEADPVPEPPTEPKAKLGEIYELGNHRVMCGDATKDTDKLINGITIDLLFTDPPYGINIVHGGNVGISANIGFVGTEGLAKARKYKSIISDDNPFEPQFLLNYSKQQIIFGANNFASKLPDNAHWLVWDKKNNAGADHNNFSDVELMWTNINRKSCLIYRHTWSGLIRAGDRRTELKERVHPTQKPVGMLRQIINDYSKSNEIILDPYLGSGSTLIACEQTNRVCYGMEIDPAYIDVILDRWSNYTGKDPVRLSDGKKWSQIKEE